MATIAVASDAGLRERYLEVRKRSLSICEPLTAEDMMVQSCPEASPAKWHLAHTAWFFESFILREFLPGCRLYDADFSWLFNSYYQTFTEFPEKKLRSSFSRPGLTTILSYREYVDQGIVRLLDRGAPAEALMRIELGLNHEEQHQELLLTDIKHALFTNPLQPAYLDPDDDESSSDARPMKFISHSGGLVEIGRNEGDGFGFDNERPRHKTWLEPFALGSRLVTCGEYRDFIEDRGYERPELWLSAGWDTVKTQGWKAPLYWQQSDGQWVVVSLRGQRRLDTIASTPVAHISYFEADAYARWAGKRLPTEAEWESVAASLPVTGNLLDAGALEPRESTAFDTTQNGLAQLFGDCWEWTASAYLGYPGFVPLGGTLGEYNGKFMSGQMVLRGGSCVTPQRHIRASYRNFFSPETRWQFSGIRLAQS